MLSSVAAAWSSKLNLRQKRLRSASPHARLMRLPIGRMDDELHAARLVEEAFEHDRLAASAGSPARHDPRADIRPAARRRPEQRQAHPSAIAACAAPVGSCSSCSAISARSRDTDCESSSRPARRLAEPERNGRRHAVRVLDADDAALDALDLVAPVAELKDVAGKAFDGEILVHGADEVVLRLQQHLIVGVVGDGAARGQSGQARAATPAQAPD